MLKVIPICISHVLLLACCAGDEPSKVVEIINERLNVSVGSLVLPIRCNSDLNESATADSIWKFNGTNEIMKQVDVYSHSFIRLTISSSFNADIDCCVNTVDKLNEQCFRHVIVITEDPEMAGISVNKLIYFALPNTTDQFHVSARLVLLSSMLLMIHQQFDWLTSKM